MVTDIVSLISNILNKLDKDLLEKLTEWGKIVQLNIDDDPYYINFKESINLIDGEYEGGGDFAITSSFLTFKNILEGKINPVQAVVSGEVAIDGSLTTALEFSEILQNSDLLKED